MDAREYLQEKIKTDFNSRQLVNQLDALFQEVLMVMMNDYYSSKAKIFDAPVVSGSSLSEAILIVENLLAYGRIHTVNGVRYAEGSHKEMLDKAEEWLNKVRKNYR